jgi:hypothetical protein
VVLWELITRETPWFGLTAAQVITRVGIKGNRLTIPKTTDEHFHKIIERCWETYPDKRYTFKELVDALLSTPQETPQEDELDLIAKVLLFKYLFTHKNRSYKTVNISHPNLIKKLL